MVPLFGLSRGFSTCVEVVCFFFGVGFFVTAFFAAVFFFGVVFLLGITHPKTLRLLHSFL